MNYLLLNLAIADIMYAAFIAPRVYFQLTFNHPDGVIGTMFCKFVTDGSVAWIGGASSIVTLTAIAIERYYAVMYPHGNKWKLTENKLKVGPNNKLLVFTIEVKGFPCLVGGVVVSWVVRLSPDRAARVRALAGDIV